jgi:hypothetical protein
MIRRSGSALLGAAALALVTSGLRAQSAGELTTSGIAAYHAVRYDAAASLLRRALDGGAGGLSDSARAVAYAFLAATEFLRGDEAAGAAATRRALAADPRYRADTLAFPPEVTEAFETVRRSTRYVGVRAPADTTVQPGGAGYTVRLYVSAPHRLTAAIAGNGMPSRTLYEGLVSDSVDVTWRVPGADGRAPPEGRFTLEILSPATRGNAQAVRLPLDVRPIRSDTLTPPPPPADSLFLPERERPRHRVPGIALGVLAGAITIALPSIVASDAATATRTRYALGAALGVATVAAVVTGSRGEYLPANAATNRALMDQWRREVDAVTAENRRRRGRTALRILTGNLTGGEADQ